MGQDREHEAGKEKHSHAEHRVWIFDRHTCSLVCFVLQCGPKRYLTPQLLGFSFVLDRIVHLLVTSEIFSWRGKKISKSWRGLRFGQIGDANWTALCVARHVNVVTVVGGLFQCHLPRWPALIRLIAESGKKKPSPTPAFIRIARLIFCDRRVVENHRRLHHRTFRPSRTSRGNPLCPHTGIALRARTNLQARNPAKSKTTLRRSNHLRRPLPPRLARCADSQFLLECDENI
jgi:hypothetical protein